jgi:hypothetical protein
MTIFQEGWFHKVKFWKKLVKVFGFWCHCGSWTPFVQDVVPIRLLDTRFIHAISRLNLVARSQTVIFQLVDIRVRNLLSFSKEKNIENKIFFWKYRFCSADIWRFGAEPLNAAPIPQFNISRLKKRYKCDYCVSWNWGIRHIGSETASVLAAIFTTWYWQPNERTQEKKKKIWESFTLWTFVIYWNIHSGKNNSNQ